MVLRYCAAPLTRSCKEALRQHSIHEAVFCRSAAGPVSPNALHVPWHALVCGATRQLASAGLLARAGAGAASGGAGPSLPFALAAHARQLRAALQHHQQRLFEAVKRRHAWESRSVALFNSLMASAHGQAVISAIPLALFAGLLPSSYWHAAADTSPLAAPAAATPTPARTRHARAPRPPSPLLLYLRRKGADWLEEVLVCCRAAYLTLLFTPVLWTAPLVFYCGVGRERWLRLLRWTLERAGPAFIKWGQWSATRPDLFPPDVCRSLELLQTAAPRHPAEYSKQVIEHAFGRPLHQLFDSFEDVPVASGSIAQIHRARLSAGAAGRSGCKRGTVVAIKVRHPNVTTLMTRDFVLMQRIAAACTLIPVLSELRLEESVRQFGGPLKEQLDLSVEASHLDRFRRNFGLWPLVSFPRPVRPFVAPDVLVESFEEGDLVSTYINGEADGKHNYRLGELGMNLYLQMLLKDNFIHADLHPGNILVREVDVDRLKGVARLIGGWFEYEPQLVLLDVGMIAELTPADQSSLIRFFKALTVQDGEGIARAMLLMSEAHTCKDPDLFVDDMTEMFDKLDAEYIRVYTTRVFADMIEVLRNHHVTLKSTVSTVVVTTLVLEGWASKLAPELRILDTMREIFATDWSSRVQQAVERIMTTGMLAV